MTDDLLPTTPIHVAAIKSDALLMFLTKYLGLGREELDFFAGCMKRAADEAVKSAEAAQIDDPGIAQAAAIVAEEARQVMLTPLSAVG